LDRDNHRRTPSGGVGLARVAGLSCCRGHSDAEFASPGNTKSRPPALLEGIGQRGKDEVEERVAAWHLWRPLTEEEVRQTKYLAQQFYLNFQFRDDMGASDKRCHDNLRQVTNI
jgi:hypothetical protein